MIGKAHSNSFKMCNTMFKLHGLNLMTFTSDLGEWSSFAHCISKQAWVWWWFVMGKCSRCGKSSDSCCGLLFSSMFPTSLWLFSPHLPPFTSSFLPTRFCKFVPKISYMSSWSYSSSSIYISLDSSCSWRHTCTWHWTLSPYHARFSSIVAPSTTRLHSTQ